MIKSIFYSALFFLLSAGTAAPLFSAHHLEGSWNVTEDTGNRTFPSWLRITHQEGVGWKALFLHRGGHPMPCEVTADGDSFQLEMVAESGGDPRPDADWPTLQGELQDDGTLKGTGQSWRGNSFHWTAERAPDRIEGADRKISWGDPIELFNGRDLDGWEKLGDRESQWKAVDGLLSNEGTGANLRTSREFRDFKLHLEFKIPEGSNSGIYLRGRYESQVADDYGKVPYPRMVGGIYGQLAPIVNATKPAGEWNYVDITLIGYRVTIVLNGQTTVDGQLIGAITGGALTIDEEAPGPIMLQGDHGPVQYRNIVLTPAE